MELVAHRAGNAVWSIAPAVAVADAIELDLHLFRNRIEIRHEKVVWPFRWYWERHDGRLSRLGHLDPPTLPEILAACDDDDHLWLDLKGAGIRLARRTLAATRGRPRLTVSTRFWFVLRPFRRAGIRTFRSVGSRWQLWLASRLRFGPNDGIGMHARYATPEVVAGLLAVTDRVVVWAVDDLDQAMELAAMGVTGIIADDLGLLAAVRARRR